MPKKSSSTNPLPRGLQRHIPQRVVSEYAKKHHAHRSLNEAKLRAESDLSASALLLLFTHYKIQPTQRAWMTLALRLAFDFVPGMSVSRTGGNRKPALISTYDLASAILDAEQRGVTRAQAVRVLAKGNARAARTLLRRMNAFEQTGGIGSLYVNPNPNYRRAHKRRKN